MVFIGITWYHRLVWWEGVGDWNHLLTQLGFSRLITTYFCNFLKISYPFCTPFLLNISPIFPETTSFLFAISYLMLQYICIRKIHGRADMNISYLSQFSFFALKYNQTFCSSILDFPNLGLKTNGFKFKFNGKETLTNFDAVYPTLSSFDPLNSVLYNNRHCPY